MAQKEIVLALRLSEGTTREQFRALKSAIIDVREEIAQNNKALKENAKEQRALDVALNEGKLTLEQVAVRSQKLRTEQGLLKTESANLAQQQGSLSQAYATTLKGLTALDDGTDRFRAAQVALIQTAVKQQDALAASTEKAKQLATVSKQLFDQYKGTKGTDEAFNAINTAINSATAALKRNKTALAQNEAAEQALAQEVRLAGVATEDQSRKLEELATESAQLNAVNSSLQNSLGQLRGVIREVGNDTKGLTDAGLRFRDKMAEASAEALKQSGILGQLGARMDFLRAEQDRLTKEQAEGKVTADQYNAAMNKLANEEKELAAQTTLLNGKVDLLTKEFKEGKISADQFRAGINSIDNSVQGVGTAVNKGVADLKSYALGFVGVVAVAQAAIGAIQSIAKTVVEFDTALTRVGSLGGEFRERLDEIADAARQVGPALGFAPVEAVKAFEELAKAGLTAEQALGGGLQAALSLAAAGSLEVGSAAETAASAMTQFGLEADQLSSVADALVGGADAAQGGVDQLRQALSQSGLVAAQFGLDLQETVGALTTFASAGLLGSDAGTSFRSMLLRLAKPTKE
jgi:chromosome segregation ATPase